MLPRFINFLLSQSKILAFLLVGVTFFLSQSSIGSMAFAQTNQPPNQAIIYVTTDIIRLANLSPKDGTFDVDMWLGFRWSDATLKPYESMELINGTVQSATPSEVVRLGGDNYVNLRVKATIYHDFDVHRYPLDNHVLEIIIEDRDQDISNLAYVPANRPTLDKSDYLNGWDAKLNAPYIQEHRYVDASRKIDEGDSEKSYSRLTIPIELERTSLVPLIKSFWALYLAVAIALLAFLVKATDLDARFGLGLGSIFAATANAFFISDNLPKTTFLTLAEKINLLAVAVIYLSLLISVISLRLCHQGRPKASQQLDTVALIIISVTYIVANALLLSA